MKMHPNVYLYIIQQKKWFWCLGHSFVAISGHYWPKNGHFSALPAFGRRRFNLNGIQSGWKWTHMYIYTWHIIIQRIQNPHLSMYLYIVFIIKKGINSIDHSFMAISGHYWLKNGHFSALPAFERRRIILNDIQSGVKGTQMYIYKWYST